MKRESLWLDWKTSFNAQKLDKDLNVDVLIIGGGITGLTTFYYLKDSNLKVCLVDQDLVGHGVSGKTTGKINYLQETFFYDIGKKYSPRVAKKYFDSQIKAISELRRIIEKEKINCDLEQTTSYVFTNDKEEIVKLKLQKKLLKSWKVDVKEEAGNIGKIKNLYAISVNDTYVFHPVKYLYGLKDVLLREGHSIYERTRILNLQKERRSYIAYTEQYKIQSKKVVLACHYPFFLFPYITPLKVGIEKSYITASKSTFEPKTLITSSLPIQSFRYHRDKEDYLVYLSNSSNICNDLDDEKNFRDVIRKTEKISSTPSYIWKNDDVMTIDKIPYIGKIQKNNSNLLIGTGYNTWGMTNGTLAGMILSDFILGKENEFARLCNPLRINRFSNMGGFLTNIGSSVKGYVQNKIWKSKKWYPKEVTFTYIDGKSVAIYDDGKEKYIVYNKCPHMGCSLVYNAVEKTWDCPCHASRFDITGKCIKGPSVYDICYKNDK